MQLKQQDGMVGRMHKNVGYLHPLTLLNPLVRQIRMRKRLSSVQFVSIS